MLNHVGFFVVVYFSCNFSFHELGAEMLLLAGLPFLLFFWICFILQSISSKKDGYASIIFNVSF